MAENHRFMTYTQLEKAYRKILSRRMSGRSRNRTLRTEYRQIILAVAGNAALKNAQSDSPTLVRQNT